MNSQVHSTAVIGKMRYKHWRTHYIMLCEHVTLEHGIRNFWRGQEGVVKVGSVVGNCKHHRFKSQHSPSNLLLS